MNKDFVLDFVAGGMTFSSITDIRPYVCAKCSLVKVCLLQ